MNRMQKVYCRAVQSAFKAALPVLPYRNPHILTSVQEIPRILQQHGYSRVLLVTDPGIAALGLTHPLEEALCAAGIHVAVYDKTDANPTTRNVEDALGIYHREHCRAIIGFGGGSSMDCAKAVGVRAVRPRQPLSRMQGVLKVHHRLPLLFAIPTTAGTGSETTLAAVITDAETRHKYPVNDFCLIPRYAVLDPDVTISLPPFITATTGMDALTHAVEAYIGNSTTPHTRRAALEAVRLIFENLDAAWRNGKNRTARANMLRASYYAGCAFTQSYVGYVHAVAHSLGGEYNVPHGLANAVLLPFVLEAYGTVVENKLHDLAVAAGVAEKETPDAEAAARFIQAIRDMKRRFGIGDTIPEIREQDIPRLAARAAKEANPLYPVPVLMDAQELQRFYVQLMEKPTKQRARQKQEARTA